MPDRVYGDVTDPALGYPAIRSALLINQALQGLKTLTDDQLRAADIDGDGYVSPIDALLIAGAIAGTFENNRIYMTAAKNVDGAPVNTSSPVPILASNIPLPISFVSSPTASPELKVGVPSAITGTLQNEVPINETCHIKVFDADGSTLYEYPYQIAIPAAASYGKPTTQEIALPAITPKTEGSLIIEIETDGFTYGISLSLVPHRYSMSVASPTDTGKSNSNWIIAGLGILTGLYLLSRGKRRKK